MLSGHASFDTAGCPSSLLQRLDNSLPFNRSDNQHGASILRWSAGAAWAERRGGVHAGASGGALIHVQGQVAGLVTSNTRHATLDTFPHLNFSIAAAAELVAAA